MVPVDACWGFFSGIAFHRCGRGIHLPPYIWETPHFFWIWVEAEFFPFRNGDKECSLPWVPAPPLQQQWGTWPKLKRRSKDDREQRFFFYYFSFIECRNKFTVVPLVAAVSVCRNSHDRGTDSCILVLGPAVQVFPAVHPTFQDGSMFLFVLCHDLGCGATCPGSLWSWLSSDSLNYRGSS